MNLLFRIPLLSFLPRAADGSKTFPAKTLLVRDDVIGDLVVPTSAVVKWLNDNGYDTYLVLRHNLTAVGKLFLPEDRLIPVDIKKYRESLSYRYGFLKDLRKIGFQTAIGSIIHSAVNTDIVRHSGACAQFGYKRRPKDNRRLRGINAVPSLSLMKDGRYVSVLEHEKHFLENIFSRKLEKLSPFAHTVKPSGLDLPEGYIHYIIDAGDSRRAYPKAKLLPLLIKIAQESGRKIVLTDVHRFDFNHEQCINLTGRTTLEDMFSIIAGAGYIIGNESGPVHLAWVMGKKTAMFYGGGRYGRFMPPAEADVLTFTKALPCFCCDWKCIYKKDVISDSIFPCVNIDENDVENALRNYLG